MLRLDDVETMNGMFTSIGTGGSSPTMPFTIIIDQVNLVKGKGNPVMSLLMLDALGYRN